ncbi:unnamed protein product [Urochloa decumbens]|uniref:Signal peptidase complex subunit 3 n=1 Tax=Urochloa decumbens TaxID=240449 RepID=A0ABC9AHQ9_9POAL
MPPPSKPKPMLQRLTGSTNRSMETTRFVPVLRFLIIRQVTLTFNLSANLESVFTWNTKQVFVFLTAEYENAKNSLNQISLWDYIIPDKEHANLQVEVKSKYPLIDQGASLRGKKVQLVLHWYVMPNAGAMIQDRMALSEFKLPDTYTS